MNQLQKLIDQITTDIEALKGRDGDYIDGVITGLAQARLHLKRELAASPAEVRALVEGVAEGTE